MALDKGEKATLVEQYGKQSGDTGSSEVQVALLTKRITDLNDHLRTHKGDNHARYGLIKLVGQRRAHLKYLSRKDPAGYRELLAKLGLRR
jgi:small subunit ribosomal protein S15